MNYLIKNGKIIDTKNEKKRDIYIEDGIIRNIGENLTNDADVVIDAEGSVVMPGLVDIHCHLRDPGYTYKEDILSGALSAAAGGFTSIVAMPNTKPTVDNAAVAGYVAKKAEEAVISVYQAGAISKNLEGKELAEMGEMKKIGIVAVTDDGRPVSDSGLMKKALLYANMLDLPVIAHEEDLALADGGAMNEGYTATSLGLRGINKSAEEAMIARDLVIAKNTDTKVHITHISTKGSVDMIRNAKKEGVKVTCDTCPHYFSLDEGMCEGFNTNAKMNPPLRTPEDIEAISNGLKDGTIDAIATDHAPHHTDEKNCEFDKALNGIIGFETAFAVAYKYLVLKHDFALTDIVRLMSYNPARLLKLDGGEIKPGDKANLIIADLNRNWTYNASESFSKSKNSPYDKFMFEAKVTHVFAKGNLVIENERPV